MFRLRTPWRASLVTAFSNKKHPVTFRDNGRAAEIWFYLLVYFCLLWCLVQQTDPPKRYVLCLPPTH